MKIFVLKAITFQFDIQFTEIGENGAIMIDAHKLANQANRPGQEAVIIHHEIMEEMIAQDRIMKKGHATPTPAQVRKLSI